MALLKLAGFAAVAYIDFKYLLPKEAGGVDPLNRFDPASKPTLRPRAEPPALYFVPIEVTGCRMCNYRARGDM